MSTYDWSQFHVHMYYLAPIDDVFRRFSTATGLESFYLRTATFTAADGRTRAPDECVQPGDAYDWQYAHDFGHPGVNQRPGTHGTGLNGDIHPGAGKAVVA